MLEAVVGLIGGGKSCLAIYRALKYVSEGGRVYMNMRLTGALEVYDIETHKMSLVLPPDAPFCCLLRKRYKWEYQQGQYNFLLPEDMDDGFQNVIPAGTPEKKVLVVLDEVNEWFDSLERGKASSDASYRKTLRFMRQSRKVYIDVIFILQIFSTLNDRIRNLIGYVWQCRDMQYFEVAGLSVGFFLKRFFVWQKYYKDMKVAIAKPKWVVKDLEVFKCYDTTEIFGDGLGVLPAGSVQTNFAGAGKIQTIRSKKMNPLQTAILVLCCVSSAFASFMLYKGGNGSSSSVRVVTLTNTVALASASGGPSAAASSRVEWAPLSYGRCGDVEWCYAGGRMYKPGFRTDKGMVVSVDRYSIRLIDESGEHWIFHNDGGQQSSFSTVAKNGGAK